MREPGLVLCPIQGGTAVRQGQGGKTLLVPPSAKGFVHRTQSGEERKSKLQTSLKVQKENKLFAK